MHEIHQQLSSASDVKLVELTSFDAKGSLVPIEELRQIPFNFRRIFYVYDVPVGETRGEHAHRDCKQALICLKGKAKVTCDDGTQEFEFVLDSPRKCLVIPPGIWGKEVYEEEGTILLVLSDVLYNPDEYIHEYPEFLKFRKGST
jgi:hypothetical protein